MRSGSGPGGIASKSLSFAHRAFTGCAGGRPANPRPPLALALKIATIGLSPTPYVQPRYERQDRAWIVRERQLGFLASASKARR